MKFFCFLSFFFVCFLSFSQDELIKEATFFIKSNKVFGNHQKEKFFLHTNKTTYFSGEHINYKAYIVDDDTNLLSQITTNLHVSMYDYNRKLIKHQLVFVENGTVNNSMLLEKTLESGTYFLLLDTSYNASFNKQNISEIQVINLLDLKSDNIQEIDVTALQTDENKELQVVFFPESNVLLSRANNTLYYQIVQNGKPIEAQGELINSVNDVVVDKFGSNNEGIGSINFDYYPDREYYFKIFHDQKTYKINVPIAQKEGFVVHHNANKSNSKEVSFTIRINNDTAAKNDNQTILAVIHRNNTCKSVIPFKIDKDINNYLLSINSESLFNGINIISLFNKNNEVLSSRYFFHDKNKKIELSIDKFKETKDSLTIDLQMLNSFVNANTSVSILPEQNVINNTEKTIYKAFLITPYVANINNLKNIDLTLQIVSPKNNIPETNNELEIREVENGISISGNVSTNMPNLYGYNVLLTSKENGLALMSPVEKDKKFSFNNLLLYHPTRFELALLGPTGRMVDANFEVEDQKLNYPLDSIFDVKQKILIKDKKDTVNSIHVDNQSNFVYEGEKLNEVMIFGKKRKEVVVDDFPDFGYIDNPGELGNGFIRRKTKDKFECMGCTLFEYLDQFSELKTIEDPNGGAHVYFKTRGFNTFFGSINALLIIDGIPTSLNILLDIMAEDVKAVKLNRAGAGYGFRGSNGVIMVELKKPEDYLDSEPNNTNKTKSKTFSSKTTFGFAKTKDLFNDNNLIFNSQKSIEKYSVIDWIPNFNLRPNSPNFIKIAKENYTALKLIINGINDQGGLVFEEVNILFDQ